MAEVADGEVEIGSKSLPSGATWGGGRGVQGRREPAVRPSKCEGDMGLILLLLIVLLIVGAAPWHPYSRPYGWYGSGALGLLLLVILVLILLGAIPHGVGTHPYYW